MTNFYAYINTAELAAFCVMEEDNGIEYDPKKSREEFLRKLGTIAILSDKDPQVFLFGENYHWVKIEEGWCVKYVFSYYK